MKVQDFDPRDYLRKNQFRIFSVPAADTVSLSVHWFGRFTNWNSPWTKWPSSQDRLFRRLTAYIDSNTFHVTHGRPIAFATGIALTRPDLKWWSLPETGTAWPSAETPDPCLPKKP